MTRRFYSVAAGRQPTSLSGLRKQVNSPHRYWEGKRENRKSPMCATKSKVKFIWTRSDIWMYLGSSCDIQSPYFFDIDEFNVLYCLRSIYVNLGHSRMHVFVLLKHKSIINESMNVETQLYLSYYMLYCLSVYAFTAVLLRQWCHINSQSMCDVTAHLDIQLCSHPHLYLRNTICHPCAE